MKLTNKELRQKLNELMDEIISVKEWIFNAIEIEPELPEMKKNLKELEKELSETLGSPVEIKHSKKGSGKIIVSYKNLDTLEGVLDKFKS